MKLARAGALVGSVLLAIVGGAMPMNGVHAYSYSDANAVNWSVDYNAEIITVSVNLAFYAPCAPDVLAAAGTCTNFVESGPMPTIVNAITTAWNGHSFKCFKFKVKLNAIAVESESDVPPNTIGIQLSGPGVSPGNAAYTDSDGPRSDPESDDPAFSLVPLNSPDDPSTWSLITPISNYVHEFGHILGLDDNYVIDPPGTISKIRHSITGYVPPVNGHLLPGGSDDAMYANGSTAGVVSQDMVDRVVLRSGKVDTSKVKCAMSMDIAPTSVDLLFAQLENFTLHAYTCDYQPITTDPKHPPKPMHFRGELSYSGGVWEGALDALGPSGGSVKFPVSFDLTVPANGPGTATIAPDPKVVLTSQFVWTGDGLIGQVRPFALNGIQSESLNSLVGAPGNFALNATVTHGASECKK